MKTAILFSVMMTALFLLDRLAAKMLADELHKRVDAELKEYIRKMGEG